MNVSKKLSFVLIISFISEAFAIINPTTGEICHVEADYNYPGVWEPYSETELICNYWKFLGDDIIWEEDMNDSLYNDNNEIEIFDELQDTEE